VAASTLRGENIVGLAIEPDSNGELIRQACGFEGEPCYWNNLKVPEADIAISAWGRIFKKSFIDLFPLGIVNLHGSYLPQNRGLHGNAWAFIDRFSGVSIHYIDEGIDTGDLIARRRIPVLHTDTAGSLYERTLDEMAQLFSEYWPLIKAGTNPRTPQSQLPEPPSYHSAVDIDALDRIDLDAPTTARQVIDQLRSRTYGNVSHAYHLENGAKTHVGVFFPSLHQRQSIFSASRGVQEVAMGAGDSCRSKSQLQLTPLPARQ
jgi:methionyl-tRNA formyltransferase